MAELPLKPMLDDAGLNRQHVFRLHDLPADLLEPLAVQAHETQLILLGHAGRRLWQRVQAEPTRSAHPIDDYSVHTAWQWLAQVAPDARCRVVYPRGQPGGLPEGRHVGLQRLGLLAGWHHASPFMIGVDATWGSWFAYRVVMLADTDLPPSAVIDAGHPCPGCAAKPCITACPAGALDSGTMDPAACQRQRLAPDSACAYACLARQACPVGAEHRYEASQIRHSSAGSLAAIRRHAG
ncbi:MAG: hypothetical protein KBC73_09660 [Burkholderiaceae bacterium]|nr:hypothetical protein [Burkholderiaceae bacterium]